MSEFKMSPTEAADELEKLGTGYEYRRLHQRAARVLIDHARATAAPGDFAEAIGLIDTIARRASQHHQDAQLLRNAVAALRAHRCAPAVEVVTPAGDDDCACGHTAASHDGEQFEGKCVGDSIGGVGPAACCECDGFERPASSTTLADSDLLTLPAEPPVGTTIRIEGGGSNGQVWEHVHVGLTPDSTIHWRRTNGQTPDWSRWSGLWWRLTEDDAKGQLGLRIVPKPLAPGDTVARDDVSRLLVGTWVQYAHGGQRGLVTGYEVFDGKARALVSEHGEQLPFSDLVDEVWPLTVLGLPTGGVS